MKSLNNIIKEELSKVLINTNEGVEISTQKTNDDIINNYELGRKFANNKLQVDINNLNTYDLTDYSPEGLEKEDWFFGFNTTTGGRLLVSIRKEISNYKTLWSMFFATEEKGEDIELIKKLEDIEGYDLFVAEANKSIANDIDPSKY